MLNNVMAELDRIKLTINNEDVKSFFIDLAHIKNIDVSGLAMLLEIKTIVKNLNKNLSFINHTKNILKICELYYVEL